MGVVWERLPRLRGVDSVSVSRASPRHRRQLQRPRGLANLDALLGSPGMAMSHAG